MDIVEISRVRQAAMRNRNFLRRVFAPEEIRYCGGKKKKWQHFAVRFAAKEAVWKALGRREVLLKDISIAHSSLGRPEVRLRSLKALESRLQVSLSHSDRYAVAVAVFA